ncbi:MAG: carbamoyltransferase HypF [Anaerolineae bacterium]
MAAKQVPQPTTQRIRVEISGAVQGVGFRPFVYRLATEHSLAGWVINDTRGVFIELEGPQSDLERFLERLPAEKPPRAIIHTLDTAWLEPAGYDSFQIRHSEGEGARTVLVLPDIATCDDCLTEVLDPADRRHRYPFTNCTNCGPRFTIIQALPYDRPNTTMRRFIMCPGCQTEYEDPLDRRFHAQPNACPVCGPQLALYTRPPPPPPPPPRRPRGGGWGGRGPRGAGGGGGGEGSILPQSSSDHWPQTVGRWRLAAEADDALRQTAEALRSGQIVAVKGVGGFHLMVDACNGEAIARLRERKPRRDKPFALMVRDLEQARELSEVPLQAEDLLTCPETPIVLLRRRPDTPVADEVAPGNPNLGVMLPYTPLHHLLLQEVDFPVVATSGNLTDEPICIDEYEAIQRLGHPSAGSGQRIADLFLVHDRPIERHVDDSVAWVVHDEPRLLRRARGYAPLPVLVQCEFPTILAVGAHLKNTVALSVGRQVFLSQHIGDLETPEAMDAFERVIADFLRLYEATPVAIAHDLHPDYLSTRWARNSQFAIRNSQLVAVQHHHAHLAACLAENGVAGPALGVTWDGTGYGTDGTVWGGEFLLGDAADFTRVAHLRPFRLPGGEAAIHEPRRAALALLWELYGDAALERDDLAPVRAFRPAERRLLAQMLERGVNTPVTTSAGRLFDAVAALLDLHQQVTFEGQAAMALEFAVDPSEGGAYPIALTPQDQGDEGRRTSDEHQYPSCVLRPASFVVDWQPLVEALLQDLHRGVAPGIIGAHFHNALVEAILAVAQAAGEQRVALTGGCFQNRWLTERTAQRLSEAGFEVLLHSQVPPNDGGISLGQILVASAHLDASQ